MGAAVYGAHGHFFTVETADTDLVAQVQAALATLQVAEAPTQSYRISRGQAGTRNLYFNDELVGSRATDSGVLLLLHWHINQRVIDAAAARRTTFHAAAAQPPGRGAVLLPAPMESGKTTTVTGLLRAGWDFLTDEAAGVDPDGTVWAYPKPLTIDRGSWPLFSDLRPAGADSGAESWLVPASAAGARVSPSAPLQMIVFPCYTSRASTQLKALSPSETALILAHSAFQFDRYGARDLRCVSSLARTLPAYQLTIGDLAEAVATIIDLEAELFRAA